MNGFEVKPAIIKLKYSEKGPIAIMATGEYSHTGKNYSISFSYEDADFTLGLSPDIITISKTGEQSYTLVLEKNKTHDMTINTPFGDIAYSVIPTKIKFHELENGVEASYMCEIPQLGDQGKLSMYITCVEDKNQ